MKTVYSPRHLGHAGHVEINNGRIVPAFEKPRARRDDPRGGRGARLRSGRCAPTAHGLGPVGRVHDERLLRFLAKAWRPVARRGAGLAGPAELLARRRACG